MSDAKEFAKLTLLALAVFAVVVSSALRISIFAALATYMLLTLIELARQSINREHE